MNQIEVLNNSRMARIAFDAIRHFLEEQKKRTLQRLLSETKTGPLDPQVYAKHLGAISALEELESTLRKEVIKGETTEQELLNEQLRNRS